MKDILALGNFYLLLAFEAFAESWAQLFFCQDLWPLLSHVPRIIPWKPADHLPKALEDLSDDPVTWYQSI